MKKLFTILTIFILIFTSCQDNSDVIGVWTGSYTGGTLTLDIGDGTWVMVFNDAKGPATYNGEYSRDANTLKLTESGYSSSSATASLSEGKLFLTQHIDNGWANNNNSRPSTITLNRKVITPPAPPAPPAPPPVETTLKINNQSFTEITNIIWNNVSFAENQVENSIKSGKNVIKNVQAGTGYIFFKRKTNPITARTRDVVTIDTGKNIEFTFSDNTVIVEVNNTANTGTLGSLSNTVIWWDDAEGDYLPYSNRVNATYSTSSPRYGLKCIALAMNGELSFNISLGKKAKLSFWHRAASVNSNVSNQPVLNINSEEIKKWTANNEWSFFESDLDEGNTAIQFRSTAAYLYLDDILIYYTE